VVGDRPFSVRVRRQNDVLGVLIIMERSSTCRLLSATVNLGTNPFLTSMSLCFEVLYVPV
jgi:hypothetical protein